MAENITFFIADAIKVFPTTNSKDEGKLTSEKNMSDIVNTITDKNFVVSGFTVGGGGPTLSIGNGIANIGGYRIETSGPNGVFNKTYTTNGTYYIYLKLNRDAITNQLSGDEYSSSSHNIEYKGVYIDEVNEYEEETTDSLWLYKFDVDGVVKNFETNPYLYCRINPKYIYMDFYNDLKSNPQRAYYGIYNLWDELPTGQTSGVPKDLTHLLDKIFVSKYGDTIYDPIKFSYKSNYSKYANERDITAYPSNLDVGQICVVPQQGRAEHTISSSTYQMFGTQYESYIKDSSGNILSELGLGCAAGYGNVNGLRFEIPLSSGNTSFITKAKIDFSALSDSDAKLTLSSKGKSAESVIKLLSSTSNNIDYEINLLSNKISSFAGEHNFYRKNTSDFSEGVSLIDDTYTLGGSEKHYFKLNYSNLFNLEYKTGIYTSNTQGLKLTGNIYYDKIRLYDESGGFSNGGQFIESSLEKGLLISSDSHNMHLLANDGNIIIEPKNIEDDNHKTNIKSNLDVTGNIVATGDITGARVFNAVYNDYADFVEKGNKETKFEPGDIISKDRYSDGYVLANEINKNLVVGVYSDTFGHVLGGEKGKTIEENEENYIPIGICGNVYAKVVGKVDMGDLITVSDIEGVGKKVTDKFESFGCIIGKALENKNTDDIKRIKIQIMLS